MTSHHHYIIGRERIADLLRQADHQRQAATTRAQTTRAKPPTRLLRISRRRTPLSTT
jgi:hypothetical protein